MKLNLILLMAGILLAGITRAQSPADSIFVHDSQGKAKPWTNTNFNNKPDNFQFAIVSDRTNGHRNGVFKGAIDKLNELNPEFVLSIGDYIEGYTKDTTTLNKQWNEFQGLLKPLKMPFFFVPGNHDVSNEVQHALWMKHYGRDYYHFIYKNVLFVVLNSNDGDGIPFSENQLTYVRQVLQKNQAVRWTFLLMHHPVWNNRDSNGFSSIEKVLKDRPYTVIAGHTHKYLYATHNERNYYILSTTGGSSKLRGPEFGETDHISWITMTDKGPSLVNLQLNGILSHDFSNERTRSLAEIITADAAFKPFVMLPSSNAAGQGRVYLEFNNHANLPLDVESRFFQHSSLNISKGTMKLTLPEKSQQQLSLNISPFKGKSFVTSDSLELQWNLHYISNEKGLPHLEDILKIPVSASVPKLIENSTPVFLSSKQIEIDTRFKDSKIRYTLNGKDPDATSKVYQKPFSIHQSTTVKIKVFTDDETASSGVETAKFTKLEMKPTAAGISNKDLSKGLYYSYYEGAFKQIPEFKSLKPIKSGILKSFNLDTVKGRPNQFGLLIEGYIVIEEDDLYNFYLTADDGCNLFLDNELIVDNNGSHSARMKSGFAALKKGLHSIRLEYFEDFDGELIHLEYSRKGKAITEVPYSDFYTKKVNPDKI